MVIRTEEGQWCVLGHGGEGLTCLDGHCKCPFFTRPGPQYTETDFPLHVEVGMKSSSGVLHERHFRRYLRVHQS